MRKILIGLALFAFSMGAVHAETKIGYVNLVRLMNEAPQVQEIRDELQAEFKDEEAAIEKKQEELKALQEKAQSQGKTMSDAERKSLQEEFLRLRSEFSRMLREFQQTSSKRQQEEMGQFDTVVRREVQAFAQQEGYDLILTDGVAFANASLDVTDKVLARIKDAAKKGSK